MNNMSSDAKRAITRIKAELIPNLQSMCDYVQDCVQYYLDNMTEDNMWSDDEFLEKTIEALEDLSTECNNSYTAAFESMNKTSIDFTGVDLRLDDTM